MTRFRDSRTPLPPAPYVVAVLGMLVTAYASVFVADGRAISVSLLLDAVANTLALAVMALGVRAITERVRWSQVTAWWFVPVHMLVAMVAAQLSLLLTTLMLGASAWLTTGSFFWRWLAGPARHWQLFTVVFAYAAVAGSSYVLQVASDAREAETLRHEAELARLRARLDPHVLLNTLHVLLELVRSHDRAAEAAIDRFGRVVRYVSAAREPGQELVSLRDEWAHLEDYLHLERLRFGDRLRVALHLDEAAAMARIPAVSLQPLVENALVHGIGPRPGPGHVTVQATRDTDTLVVTVTDDGVGTTVPATPDAGTALALVQARLAAHFGADARIRWGAVSSNGGWRVAVRIPLHTATPVSAFLPERVTS